MKQWNWDLTSRAKRMKLEPLIDKSKLFETEKRVSDYIQERIWFVVIEGKSREIRLKVESRMISAVSLCNECVPSDNWLGKSSPLNKIRESGLWQINELYKTSLSIDELSALINIGSPPNQNP